MEWIGILYNVKKPEEFSKPFIHEKLNLKPYNSKKDLVRSFQEIPEEGIVIYTCHCMWRLPVGQDVSEVDDSAIDGHCVGPD
jgi:hypothetical protein